MNTQTILITENEFERARIAFVRAWQKQDDLLKRLDLDGAPGTRTHVGLKAALLTLGIRVYER